jgi:hypothetical protein
MEEDSSTFLQWAMNQLQHHQHPAAAAAAAVSAAYHQQDGGVGGVGARISGAAAGDQDAAAAFPSLQALRASQPQTAVPASVRVRDLTVQVGDYGGLTNSSSSGDSPGAGAGAAMDHDAVAAAWSPHTARSRTTGLGGGSNSRPVSWNFSAASALPDATAAVARVQVQQRAASSAGRRGGSAGPSTAASSPGPVQDHIIAERRRREKINQRFIELSTVIPGLKKVIIS